MKISYQQLINAYLKARKGKISQKAVQEFERDKKTNLRKLYTELVSGTYRISTPTRFVIIDPVPREIIALSFRDRIVQHIVFDMLYPLWDPTRIYDSYANRKGKGTLFGVQRVDHFIRSCSNNYQNDCRIMKCDIQSFFYSIHKQTLFDSILKTIEPHIYKDFMRDWEGLVELIYQIIFFDYKRYTDLTAYEYKNIIPPYKCFGHRGSEYGLPLGNLTSQLFANCYLNTFDQWIKHTLKIKHYGRYVDDFVIIGTDRSLLIHYRGLIQSYLTTHLHLTLHPHKFYLQHFTRGVLFLGIKILPYHRLPGRRIVSGYLRSLLGNKRSSQMSHRGLMIHHDAWRLLNQHYV